MGYVPFSVSASFSQDPLDVEDFNGRGDSTLTPPVAHNTQVLAMVAVLGHDSAL